MVESIRTPSQLFRTPVGVAVGAVSLLGLVYSVLVVGNPLLGLLTVVLLLGGYVAAHVLLRLVVVIERLADAVERAVDEPGGGFDADD